MTKYRARRISSGRYIYRGYNIQRHPADGLLGNARYIWEAEDQYGCGFAHASTLNYCKYQIDKELDKDN